MRVYVSPQFTAKTTFLADDAVSVELSHHKIRTLNGAGDP